MAAQTHYPAKPNESMLPQRLPAVEKMKECSAISDEDGIPTRRPVNLLRSW